MQVFLELVQGIRVAGGRAQLLLQGFELLLHPGRRLRVIPGRCARGLLQFFQRRVFAHFLKLVFQLFGDVGQILERLTAGERLLGKLVTQIGDGFEGFLGGFEDRRALFQAVAGQIGELLADFLNVLLLGLLLQITLAAVFGHEP